MARRETFDVYVLDTPDDFDPRKMFKNVHDFVKCSDNGNNYCRVQFQSELSHLSAMEQNGEVVPEYRRSFPIMMVKPSMQLLEKHCNREAKEIVKSLFKKSSDDPKKTQTLIVRPFSDGQAPIKAQKEVNLGPLLLPVDLTVPPPPLVNPNSNSFRPASPLIHHHHPTLLRHPSPRFPPNMPRPPRFKHQETIGCNRNQMYSNHVSNRQIKEPVQPMRSDVKSTPRQPFHNANRQKPFPNAPRRPFLESGDHSNSNGQKIQGQANGKIQNTDQAKKSPVLQSNGKIENEIRRPGSSTSSEPLSGLGSLLQSVNEKNEELKRNKLNVIEKAGKVTLGDQKLQAKIKSVKSPSAFQLSVGKSESVVDCYLTCLDEKTELSSEECEMFRDSLESADKLLVVFVQENGSRYGVKMFDGEEDLGEYFAMILKESLNEKNNELKINSNVTKKAGKITLGNQKLPAKITSVKSPSDFQLSVGESESVVDCYLTCLDEKTQLSSEECEVFRDSLESADKLLVVFVKENGSRYGVKIFDGEEDLGEYFAMILKELELEEALHAKPEFGIKIKAEISSLKSPSSFDLSLSDFPSKTFHCSILNLEPTKVWEKEECEIFAGIVETAVNDLQVIFCEEEEIEGDSKFRVQLFEGEEDLGECLQLALEEIQEQEENVTIYRAEDLESLQLMEEKVAIYSCYSETLSEIFVRLKSEESRLNEMNKRKYELSQIRLARNPPRGSLVLSEHQDGYHRAEVKDNNYQPGKMLLTFIDYGNEEVVDSKSVFAFDEKLMEYPKFALKCKLRGFPDVPITEIASEQMEQFHEMLETESGLLKCVIFNPERNPSTPPEVILRKKSDKFFHAKLKFKLLPLKDSQLDHIRHLPRQFRLSPDVKLSGRVVNVDKDTLSVQLDESLDVVEFLNLTCRSRFQNVTPNYTCDEDRLAFTRYGDDQQSEYHRCVVLEHIGDHSICKLLDTGRKCILPRKSSFFPFFNLADDIPPLAYQCKLQEEDPVLAILLMEAIAKEPKIEFEVKKEENGFYFIDLCDL